MTLVGLEIFFATRLHL